MEGLPHHESWADTFKSFSKAFGPKKSKAQVARAEHVKAERAKKAREAKLLKEAKPQLANQGVTAADLLRDARRGGAQKHRAGSGTVI